MKKFLLSLAAAAVSLVSFASGYYTLGEAVPNGVLPEGEHRVIFQVISKNAYGFLHSMQNPSDAEQVYFGCKDVTKTVASRFDDSYVYVLKVAADGSFKIKNSVGGYAPIAGTEAGLAQSNTGTDYFSGTGAAKAGSYVPLHCITTASIKDEFYMLQLKDSNPHLEVHLDGTYHRWTYLNTGTQGQADAGGVAGTGNNTRSACAFKMYYAVSPESELVTNESVATDIVDGAVITLQCKDDNGGFDSYFNGAGSAKTVNLRGSNLFRVVAVDPSAEITQSENAVAGTTTIAFYLQQLTTEKYVGKNGDAVSAVDNKEDAAQFVAYIPNSASLISWDTKPAEYTAGINTIRFETSSTYLNCQPEISTPKYATGKGGYSYWFVSKYSELEACKIMGVQTDVVYNFPDFAGHALSMTVKGDVGVGASDFIPSVPFFAATGVEGDNSTITAENNQFTVTGTWSFPFADKEVYRIDIRKKSSEHGCSNLFYNAAANKINTRNGTDAEAFVAERLFYLDAKGFTSDGNLKVTLHSIAADETHGFQAASTGGAGSGSYSDAPTELLVVTNNTGNEGISLQHPEDANAHVNDISGELGVWNNAGSKNDLGSFLRFGSLTDSDFDELMSSEIAVFITPELLEAAKATKGAAELRALFDAAAPYYAAVAEAEALIASISNYTAEHFGEDLGYFYGTDYASIAALVPPLQTALEGTDIEAIAAATEELAAEVEKVKVHLPEAGKFYVFKGVEGGWYITPNAATGQMVMTAEHTANSVFRFGEVEGEENAFVPFNVVYQTGITGTHSLGGSETYTFYPSQSGVIGAFSIQSNATGGAGTWLYNHYDKSATEQVVNRNSIFHERCNWYLVQVNEDGTGIEEITVDTEGIKGIYDLQGRRLSAPVKGINIINGKKVLVK